MVRDAAFARKSTLEALHHSVRLRICHTEKQRATIKRELEFYGGDVAGMTMLISRYPVKRFWRSVTVVDAPSEAALVFGDVDLSSSQVGAD